MTDLITESTASADAEPVAWMREGPNTGLRVFFDTDPTRGGPATPLYTEAQMQARADAARREALEEAAEEADEYASWHDGHDDGLSGFGKMAEGARELAAAIRALKENLNAR